VFWILSGNALVDEDRLLFPRIIGNKSIAPKNTSEALEQLLIVLIFPDC